MSSPVRIQLSRRKGWKMPPNTVKVSRPGYWGNPFVVAASIKPGRSVGGDYVAVPTVEDAVDCYRIFLHEPAQAERLAAISELRGKNLACWCKSGDLCHGDILLELANADPVAA
jgi:hypothetical protein